MVASSCARAARSVARRTSRRRLYVRPHMTDSQLTLIFNIYSLILILEWFSKYADHASAIYYLCTVYHFVPILHIRSYA
jgi:hypothetical protein